MPRFSECWRCGNEGNSVCCPGCQVAKYCSNQCVKNDKFRHEAECKPVAIIKTCSSCKKSGSGLRACTGCYRVFYCNIQCQKSDRKRHKSACSETNEKINDLAQAIQFYYEYCGMKSFPKQYYWGNFPAYDGLNLLENEGTDYMSDLNIMYLGVGDLRNVALTCASLPDKYGRVLRFTLNDIESCILARLVLFLFMLIKGEPGVEKMVTEVWYSITLGEETYKYLRECLRALIDCPRAQDLTKKTGGLISISDAHLRELKDVWIKWHNLRVKGTTWIQGQRNRDFKSDAQSYRGRKAYFNCIPREHVESAKKWMEDGKFRRTQTPAFSENPTLTGYDKNDKTRPYYYCIPTDVLPFTAWDYLEVKKLKHANSLITMYGAYIENVLRNVVKKLSKKQVFFTIILSDCMAIGEHIESETTYDRILTSNLMDYIILPDLLRVFSPKLNHGNSYAAIVTNAQNWTRDFCPDADIKGFKNIDAELTRIVLQDTKNLYQAKDGGTSFREYLENSKDFIDFVRALFYCYSKTKDFVDELDEENLEATPESCKILPLRVLGNEFDLRLRDGFRNENRIAPFKMAVNRRRVTMIVGLERIMEWVPLQSE